MTDELELSCPHCQKTEVCGATQMLARLRSLGLLRREAEPDQDLLSELFRANASRLVCCYCDKTGLLVREWAGDTWPAARVCAECGQPIPRERLEFLPSAQRCARCEAAVAAAPPSEREFCSKCGEVLTVKLTSGRGLSRYQMTCPRCRR